ncbi:MAG: hypothetical protein A4E49_00214 [Methanosaeta sp. PtaU1.Bin112]|nr:MAG: hypothetical protein A4E49_00214 [Methanosaeta sp. PtaU1.Bin112]
MNCIMAFACIALLVGCAGAVKVSPTLEMDTYTDAENEDQSFGAEGTIWASSERGMPVRIAYLSFAGMTTLPQQISSATMKMYAKEVERSGNVSLHLYDQAAMDIITWAGQPEYDSKVLGTLNIGEPGWQTWDATAFVKKAASECSRGCPFSLVLVAQGDASISFASLEGSSDEKAIMQYEAS